MRPRSFVLASTDHGTMIVNRNDFHQLPTGATYGVGWQLLTYGCYDPGEIADVLQLLKRRREICGDGLVVLDCGANVGVHTLEMASFMQGWGQVIALEAQERLYYALCGNIALANLENASAMNVAVGAEPDWMKIPKPNYNKPASFGSLELRRAPNNEYIGQSINYSGRDSVDVQVVTIDTLATHFKWNRFDFLKLDVEGMELEALKGGQEMIARFRPFMLIEWIKSDRQALEDFLASLNYSFLERGGNLEALPNDFYQPQTGA